MKIFRIKASRQKGQSLIETLFFSFVLSLLIYVALMVFWVGTSLLWIEHQLYQGLVCSAQQKQIQYCQKVVLQQIQRLEQLGVVQSVRIQKKSNTWKGEIKWNFRKKDFTIKQTLRLSH